MSRLFEELMDDIAEDTDATDALLAEGFDPTAAKKAPEGPDAEEAPEAPVVTSEVTPEVVKKSRSKKTAVVIEDSPAASEEDEDEDEDEDIPISESTRAEQAAGRALLVQHAVYMKKMKAVDEAEEKALAKAARAASEGHDDE